MSAKSRLGETTLGKRPDFFNNKHKCKEKTREEAEPIYQRRFKRCIEKMQHADRLDPASNKASVQTCIRQLGNFKYEYFW